MVTSATTVSVATQQEEVKIELNRTAVIVVDMQNDFGHPDGMFARADVDISGIPAPDGTTGRILIRDTWNTDIVDELTPEAGDAVIYKHRFSGFYETGLHELLQRSNIKYLVFTGGTTSVCVESTMRDAFYRDYCCLLLEDCTAEPIGQSNHHASLNLLGRVFGWTCSSEDLLAVLKQPATAPSS
jgi:ureidoacrylate peracid hydrolase